MCDQHIKVSCEEFLAGKRNDLTLEQLAKGVIAISKGEERYRQQLNKCEKALEDIIGFRNAYMQQGELPDNAMACVFDMQDVAQKALLHDKGGTND